MKSIYGHEVQDISSARIVSSKEARRLQLKALENDRQKDRLGFSLSRELHPDIRKKLENE